MHIPFTIKQQCAYVYNDETTVPHTFFHMRVVELGRCTQFSIAKQRCTFSFKRGYSPIDASDALFAKAFSILKWSDISFNMMSAQQAYAVDILYESHSPVRCPLASSISFHHRRTILRLDVFLLSSVSVSTVSDCLF